MSSGKKILLIEDFPVIQKLYGDYLKSHGYYVEVASNGEVALAKTKETEFDYILVDLLLPDINGVQFLEKFSDRPKQTRLIVLSDFNEQRTVERAKELGVEMYLVKAENTPSQLVAKLKLLEAQDKK